MRVLKFGGTSLADPQRFKQAVDLIADAHNKYQAGVVLSAPAKITNYLVALVDKAVLGESYTEELSEAKAIFYRIIDGLYALNDSLEQTTIKEKVDNEFNQLSTFLAEISAKHSCPEPLHAIILSLGERLSITMMRGWFESKGVSVHQIDPVSQLLAHGSHLESSVDLTVSKERFAETTIANDSLVLMPGFTAGNEKGELVLLGRNGSDYSAAVLAACLQADCCEIWTDVDGVFTCDPRLVKDARQLEHMSYQEAMELSYFGAKVIHPRTVGPLVRSDIPCVIKNTYNPTGAGTTIDNKVQDKSLRVKGITNLDNVSMFNVSGPGMQGMVGMASRVFSTMSEAGISVILITQSSSEYSISFCVPSKFSQRAQQTLEVEFAKELSHNKLEEIKAIDNLAIISVVGDKMKQSKGVAASFFSALSHANINIVAIAQGSSERSISTVVPQNKAIQAVKATHRALFDSQQVVDVFIVGAGGVGGELVDQIERQKEYLAKKNILIKVYAIANSRHLLIDNNALNLSDWREQLKASSEPFHFKTLEKFIVDNNVVNPVLVDCTSNQQIADSYVELLSAGFHVVTPNKKANTTTLEYYRKLRRVAQENQRKFMYETNVGAGLPVIDNLQKLLAAGDEVTQFDGILSGSLSFIFGKLEEGLTLSEATKVAKEKGFTEPDPRDDLSGTDVARKLLIIARESGLPLSLEDIQVESILPEGFASGTSVDEFMKQLPELDEEFSQRVKAAQDEGKVLRYIGRLENGICKVAIVAVDGDDPLYKVKNGENALAFYTRYYNPIPLLLRGYGAGNDVTAAGIFADILRTLSVPGGV